FGAGYRIALRDMEIRGCGNLLGAEQHGHMEAVGYDLYIKLLNMAVLEEKGEKPAEEPECTVSLNQSAFLPENYVRYPAQRMALYKRIALIRTKEDVEDMTDELGDRYGDLPAPALNLLGIALIRAQGMVCGIGSIRQDGNTVTFRQEKFDLDIWSDLADLYRGRLRVVMGAEMTVRLQLRQGDDAIKLIQELFEKYIGFKRAEG
ncbi:MAG: transcription-repair coupling factor, partial [Clostridia bacterium]|nr:transcription-repair coupling factor [Clostridia bacterium]